MKQNPVPMRRPAFLPSLCWVEPGAQKNPAASSFLHPLLCLNVTADGWSLKDLAPSSGRWRGDEARRHQEDREEPSRGFQYGWERRTVRRRSSRTTPSSPPILFSWLLFYSFLAGSSVPLDSGDLSSLWMLKTNRGISSPEIEREKTSWSSRTAVQDFSSLLLSLAEKECEKRRGRNQREELAAVITSWATGDCRLWRKGGRQITEGLMIQILLVVLVQGTSPTSTCTNVSEWKSEGFFFF